MRRPRGANARCRQLVAKLVFEIDRSEVPGEPHLAILSTSWFPVLGGAAREHAELGEQRHVVEPVPALGSPIALEAQDGDALHVE